MTVVDLDLDALLPTPRTFQKNGEVYKLPGEVPIPTVVRALQMLGAVEEANDEQIFSLLTEMYELLVALLREVPGQTIPADFQLSQREVLLLMGLLTGQPGQTLSDAVTETLKVAGAGVDGEGNVTDLPPTPPSTAKRRKAGGSRSRKRSPAPSSV